VTDTKRERYTFIFYLISQRREAVFRRMTPGSQATATQAQTAVPSGLPQLAGTGLDFVWSGVTQNGSNVDSTISSASES